MVKMIVDFIGESEYLNFRKVFSGAISSYRSSNEVRDDRNEIISEFLDNWNSAEKIVFNDVGDDDGVYLEYKNIESGIFVNFKKSIDFTYDRSGVGGKIGFLAAYVNIENLNYIRDNYDFPPGFHVVFVAALSHFYGGFSQYDISRPASEPLETWLKAFDNFRSHAMDTELDDLVKEAASKHISRLENEISEEIKNKTTALTSVIKQDLKTHRGGLETYSDNLFKKMQKEFDTRYEENYRAISKEIDGQLKKSTDLISDRIELELQTATDTALERHGLIAAIDLWAGDAKSKLKQFQAGAVAVVFLLLIMPAIGIWQHNAIARYISDVSVSQSKLEVTSEPKAANGEKTATAGPTNNPKEVNVTSSPATKTTIDISNSSNTFQNILAVVSKIAFISIPILFYVWLVRLVVRYTLRSMVLMDDAKRRAVYLEMFFKAKHEEEGEVLQTKLFDALTAPMPGHQEVAADAPISIEKIIAAIKAK